jgi:hypothetical protein
MMLAVQAVGVCALLIDILSVQRKRRTNILAMQMVASVTWVIHFFLLGAISGAAMNAVGIIRSLSYYKWRGKHRPRRVLYMILALSVIMAAITWQGALSVLPLAAMIIAATAFWQRGEQVVRILLLVAAPLWFAYNFFSHSYAGMTSDVLALVSLSLALYRYRHQGFRPAPVLQA